MAGISPCRIVTSLGVLGLVGLLAAGCVDPESPLIQQSAEGCDELSSGDTTFSNVDVDADVRAVMVASLDFSAAAERLKTDAFESCSAIAVDLGADDSWSGIQDVDARISNSDGTGACDRAGSKVEEILINAEQINVAVAIAISKGECHLDFNKQIECDKQCSQNQTCDSGSVETRCDPAHLSVVCQGECATAATCVGTSDLPANCMGACESECQGECKGTCVNDDGTKVEADPNCHGKCSSSCNGTCRGLCKCEQPVDCGANVRCTGGCTGTATEPTCTTTFTPPTCTVNTECHDACTAHVCAVAACTPTTVSVFVDVSASAELTALRDTLQAHLPKLVDAAEKDGKLALDAVVRLSDSATRIQGHVDTLNGKSLSCLSASADNVSTDVTDIRVSVDASARITTITHEHAI